MAKVVIYTLRTCPFCIRAKRLLDEKGAVYQEFCLDDQPELRPAMEQLSGRTSVPQIFINDKHIGGCDDLYALNDAGSLDELLK